MGLAITKVPLGDYQEGHDAVASAIQRIAAAALQLDCAERPKTTNRSALAYVASLLETCYRQVDAATTSAQPESAAGDPKTAFGAARAGAIAQVNRAERILTTLSESLSPIDREIAGYLMQKWLWDSTIISTAQRLFASYEQSPRAIVLEDALMNLEISASESQAIFEFTSVFEWKREEADCARDHEVLLKSLHSKLDVMLNALEKITPRSERQFVTSEYGRAALVLEPAVTNFGAKGWYPGVLWYEGIISWSYATAGITRDVLPSQMEALFLVDTHLSTHRTLYAEFLLGTMNETIAYALWETGSVAVAASAKSVNALTTDQFWRCRTALDSSN